MTMKLHIFASGLLLAISFTACSGEKKETTEKEGVETVLPSLPNEVTVMPLKKQVFNHELISNGQSDATSYARRNPQTHRRIHVYISAIQTFRNPYQP